MPILVGLTRCPDFRKAPTPTENCYLEIPAQPLETKAQRDSSNFQESSLPLPSGVTHFPRKPVVIFCPSHFPGWLGLEQCPYNQVFSPSGEPFGPGPGGKSGQASVMHCGNIAQVLPGHAMQLQCTTAACQQGCSWPEDTRVVSWLRPSGREPESLEVAQTTWSKCRALGCLLRAYRKLPASNI